jgi:hypothetical protein
MGGPVVNATSGYVPGAAGVVTTNARNADLERNRMTTTTSNLSPSIYIMAAFASSAGHSSAGHSSAGHSSAGHSSAGHSSAAALPKVLTEYLVEGEKYDTYQIPVGTRLFKSYRDALAKWSPERVFPVKSPAYFGFDEPNVSENYGFAFAYKTTQPYELLAIDSPTTLKYLWGLAADREDVQKTLKKCFGYDPEKPQIRTSDEKLDYVLVDFLCNHGFEGYAGDYIATASGGQFHPECVMCGDPIHVEINTEYNVIDILGLASPIGKHRKIQNMLTERRLKQTTYKSITNNGKRNLESADIFEDSENEYPDTKRATTVSKNLFDDYDSDGGSRRKKRTQKRTQIRRQKRTRRHKRTQIKSRK